MLFSGGGGGGSSKYAQEISSSSFDDIEGYGTSSSHPVRMPCIMLGISEFSLEMNFGFF